MEHRVLPLEGSGDITWLSGKEIGRQFKRRRFNPWVAKIPWRRKRQPTPAFLPGKPHGQKSLVGYGPWGRKEESGVAERRNNNRRHHQSLRRAGPNAGSLPGDGTMCSQWNATEGVRDEGRGATNSSADRTEGSGTEGETQLLETEQHRLASGGKPTHRNTPNASWHVCGFC